MPEQYDVVSHTRVISKNIPKLSIKKSSKATNLVTTEEKWTNEAAEPNSENRALYSMVQTNIDWCILEKLITLFLEY